MTFLSSSSICAILIFISSASFSLVGAALPNNHHHGTTMQQQLKQTQQQRMNLVPHEQNLFETINGASSSDVETIRALYHRDAHIEVYSGPELMESGTFDETFGPHWKNLSTLITYWEPITHTDAKHPENGAFAVKWTHYGRTHGGCEGMFSGFSVVKFNKRGQIISDKAYSPDIESAWNCWDDDTNTSTKTERKDL